VQVVVSASVTFDAGHRAALPPACSFSRHGHRWEIRAFAEGDEYLSVLMEQISAIANELRNRDLDEMLPGVPATPTGIAAYVRERINLGVPTLTSVNVDNGMWASTVVVERR
jgi:hypothetical protein